MSIELRKEYLSRIKNRYQNAGKFQKSRILDEFCTNCEYSRKYAIRILNGTVNPLPKRSRGRRVKYGPPVVWHLHKIWEAMNRSCSKNLVAGMPHWLPHYYGEGLTHAIRNLLLAMSPATVDRLLKPYRAKLKGISTTRSVYLPRIPLELLSGLISEPGFLEGDTVAHCGGSLVGSFANTLTATDLGCGWTENRATYGKESKEILLALKDIEDSCPFAITGFASDNGCEFINYAVANYLLKRPKPVKFVRRRPYKKNDNAHVEQRNYTHVRQLFGYQRIDHPELIALMNEIYKNYWNPLRNYFHPCHKLKQKTRIGAKIQKKYDIPKSPYHRLMESKSMTDEQKEMLSQTYRHLNPFHLKRELDRKLKIFWQHHRNLNSVTEEKTA